jgi:asparagine synthase (glutamine-hydrolysing)
VGLGHQRLSIIDLSETGAQPMRSQRGGGWIVYNGEVYNFVELREELRAHGWSFRGTSDTEVVLAALEEWGLDAALKRFNGMWAFAWLDQRGQRLVLARDRLGVKPLYVCRTQQQLVFASEIKTILAMTKARMELNGRVAADYVSNFSLDADGETFFRGIEKVKAGHYAIVDLRDPSLALSATRYWSVALDAPPNWAEEDASERFRELFVDAVRIRLRSDVPVGLMLSGGLDSSSIAAVMRRQFGASATLHAFSAVSRDPRYDESGFIDVMARHVGSDVHKAMLSFTAEEGVALFDQVCWVNDEPPRGFAVVAGYLLMRLAKELGITVILSGQGADETLCGYRKYVGFHLQSLVRQGHVAAAAMLVASFARQRTVLREFTFGEAARYLPRLMGGRLDVRGPALESYPLTPLGLDGAGTVQARQVADLTKFSIPIITHYEDRVSMAWSREIRSPFLDYRLVEAMVAAPISWKLNHGWTKYVLRKAMAADLPTEIAWRRDKKGFDTPEGEWIRKDFRSEVLRYFGPDALIFKHRLVNRERLLSVYDRYVKQTSGVGAITASHVLGSLSLELWLRRYESSLSLS